MNKNDGFIVTKFLINSTDFCLYSNQNIVAYVDSSKKVYCYDFEGNLDTELKIDKFTSNYHLIGISNDKLIFFDQNQVALNF